MKKIISLALGSLLLLGATACSDNANTTATDGDGVRNDQIESDARARDQRERTNTDTATTNGDDVRSNQMDSDARARDQRERTNTDTATTNGDEVRNDQTQSDARARDQRDGMNPTAGSEQQTTGDLAVDVRNSLETKLPGSRLAVDVNDNNGVATIDGTVRTQDQFDQINPLVMAFDGIQSVDVNAEVDPN